jgi:replicative DNA helicase
MNAVVKPAFVPERKPSASAIEALRVPPHSIDAEQSVLGGLMLSPDALDKIADRINEDDFYRKDHRLIWRAVTELSARGQPCDAVTMGDWFENNGLAEMVGGPSYLIELSNSTPSAANIVAYAQIVREKSVRRQLIDRGTTLVESAYAPDGDSIELLDNGIGALMSLQRTETRSEYTLRQAMAMAYEDAQRARENGGQIPGIRSGLTKLDRALGGFHDSDLIVVGARPAMGKTALMLNFAAACELPCGIDSTEQPAKQLAARIMAIRSHVPAELMRTGRFEVDHLRRLGNAIEDLSDRTCLIYDRSAPNIAELTRVARKWHKHNRIRILFVDYIQRIEAVKASRSANRAEKVGEVARGLKNIARELDIPVIALAQVGRQAEGRQPTMADLSDSSEIEKEADQVLTLDRPHVYDQNQPENLARISIEKNRHGPTWRIDVAWLPETMRFTDLEPDHA